MEVCREEVKRIAKLAKLKFDSDEKIEAIKKDMDQILTSVSVLGEIDTENVLPLINPNEEMLVFREDIPENEEDIKDILLQNAPDKDSDFVRIKKFRKF